MPVIFLWLGLFLKLPGVSCSSSCGGDEILHLYPYLMRSTRDPSFHSDAAVLPELFIRVS
jgi:hypothetical protein